MGLTYAQMQNRIADELQRTDLTIEIQKAIQDAIHFYRVQPYYQQDATDNSTTTVAGTQSYAVPSDMVWPRVVWCVTSNTRYRLNPSTYDEIQDENTNASSPVQGQPWDYAIYGSNLYLFPVPDSGYTIEYEYVGAVAAPTAASDSNAWTDDMEPMIRNMAKALLCAEVLGYDQEAQKFAAISEKFNTVNRQESMMRKYPRRIRPYE